jgi:diacylglycerol kinase (CTP)
MTESNIAHSGFKNRSDLHVARKVWHMAGVFTIFAGWILLPFWVAVSLLIFVWLMFVPVDVIRQKNKLVNQNLTQMFRPIMRSSELNRLAGTTYLLTGVILIAFIFNRGVVSISLLFLAFADPLASYIGIKYGKDKIFGHKSFQGFLAAFFVCAAVCWLYLFYNHVTEHLFIASIIAGLIGAFAELIPLGKIDDNFTMPVLSSIGLTILFYFFGFYTFFPSL